MDCRLAPDGSRKTKSDRRQSRQAAHFLNKFSKRQKLIADVFGIAFMHGQRYHKHDARIPELQKLTMRNSLLKGN